MPDYAALSRLARNIRNPNLPQGVPRSKYPTFHVGWLDEVDNGRNVASFAWNDPDGTITAGVPISMSYTPDHLPAAGHLVEAMLWGNTMRISNRIIVPDGVVIVP